MCITLSRFFLSSDITEINFLYYIYNFPGTYLLFLSYNWIDGFCSQFALLLYVGWIGERGELRALLGTLDILSGKIPFPMT